MNEWIGLFRIEAHRREHMQTPIETEEKNTQTQ